HSATSELLLNTNTFLSDIAEGALVHFPYTSLDGKKLIAWILLPVGYRAGRRYPMITFPYPSYNFSASVVPWEVDEFSGLESESAFNMQIAAAHGYAVLFPSVPLAYEDRKDMLTT